MYAFACVAALALVSVAGLAEAVVTFAVADGGRPRIVQRSGDPALEAAMRGFRVQVYNTYRLNREEFARRRAAGEQAQARWRDAGGRPNEQQALIHWLEEATQQSRPEIRGTLPEPPDFGPLRVRGKPSEQRGRRASRGDAVQPESPAIVTANREPPGRSTLRRAATPLPTAPGEWDSPLSTVQSANVIAERSKLGSVGVPAAIDAVESPARTKSTLEPLGTKVRDVPAIDPEPIPLGLDVDQKPAATSQRTIRSELNRPNAVDVDEAPIPRDVPAIAAPDPRGRVSGPQAADTAPPRRIALATPANASTAQDVPARLARPARTIESRPSSAVGFNVGELWSRMSGYGVGLRTVESVLQANDDFSAAELAILLDELEDLLSQRRDLLLYERLVSAKDRERLVRTLPFPQATVAGLGSRIARVRERLDARAGSDSAERDRQLQTLEELSRRLSRVHQE
ncbi:MAG: hypothetical protein WD894_18110 [Pirellulales bacterium]